jgi:hypothetical protein
MVDADTHGYKYPINYRTVADRTVASQTLTLRWANENSSTWNADRTTDMSIFQKIMRPGRFQRRNHEIEYSGTEQVEIEGIEVDVGIAPT